MLIKRQIFLIEVLSSFCNTSLLPIGENHPIHQKFGILYSLSFLLTCMAGHLNYLFIYFKYLSPPCRKNLCVSTCLFLLFQLHYCNLCLKISLLTYCIVHYPRSTSQRDKFKEKMKVKILFNTSNYKLKIFAQV